MQKKHQTSFTFMLLFENVKTLHLFCTLKKKQLTILYSINLRSKVVTVFKTYEISHYIFIVIYN
jgi:hypothetical protein